MSFCAMAEDIAARWMGGYSNVIAEVQRRIRLGKQSKPVRVKVLGDFSDLYLMNGVGDSGATGSNPRRRCHRADRAWLSKAVRPNFALGVRSNGTGFAEGTLWNIRPRSRRSLRLDAREPHHLGPLLGFRGDEVAKVGGRARNHCTAEIGNPRLDFGISKAGVDLLV